MGGVEANNWLEAPERPAVLVGTQDMLLSRALMRGYASSRALWPMEFALLHQDTQWVFDEVQLMGAGRATSAQLEAFRRDEASRRHERNDRARPCRSLWISATLEPEWLSTVDHPAPNSVMRVDPDAGEGVRLQKLARAPKHLHRAPVAPVSSSVQHEKEYVARLADHVADVHRTGHMTLVIVNQVKRAQALFSRVHSILEESEKPVPTLSLLHSRFRRADREREMAKIRDRDNHTDVIVIATQAVEAGVDISAAAMVTELAPWASMVQRFGRANRRAEVVGGADVYWIDLLDRVPADEKQATALSRPYEARDLRQSRSQLARLTDVAPAGLPPPDAVATPRRVIRRKDLDDLYDTDSDLTGFDLDISPYVRDAEDTDIRVFWRELPVADNGAPPAPSSDELCAVPIGQARKWLNAARKKATGPAFFVRDPQWRRREGNAGGNPPGWVPFREAPWPGITLLVDVEAGGYGAALGFTGDSKHAPTSVTSAGEDAKRLGASDGHDGDPRSEASRPILLADHLQHVVEESYALNDAIGVDEPTCKLLVRAARWHDVGKAHEVFQDTMRRGLNGREIPEGDLLAKTSKSNLRHKRGHFRHELASALAFLAHENWSREADLTAYLIAAHHGKVRMNVRALPREQAPQEPEKAAVRFARGIREGDELPAVDLIEGERWQGAPLTLSIMELGWDETTRESWTERTRELLARHGPFELAWLETLLRIADWRASAKETASEVDDD